ncbi:hypothetical protein PoB_004701000 [Plakobranchus ocellatus]|uniref:Uncharacterized protein n=1 Tax=Plakobranchus ocellatus TaxID=259542 RepID=A0AAV4BN99_9GAST|nr:hypothetical protein PoB_004701000 [Plakobranchus ocellatus]
MEGSARGVPARGFVGEAGINSAQKAPARGLVRRGMEDNNVQEAPARGLVKVGTGNHHQISRSPACHRCDQNRNAKSYRRDCSQIPIYQRRDGATEVSKVRCLGGHMCDRNQPLTEETRATAWS